MIKKRVVRLTVHIPFEGDPGLFEWMPSRYTSVFPRADIVGDELVFKFDATEGVESDIKAALKSKINEVQQYLSWVEADIENFSKKTEADIRQEIRERKNRIEISRELLF